MSLSPSGHSGRRSDRAVLDTDTKSRRGLRIRIRFSAIRNYAGRAPELSFGLPWDAGGGSSNCSSRERACARDHYPLHWRCAGSRPPTTQSAVLPLSCVSIPSKKSSLSFITTGATKTITHVQAVAHNCIRDCSCGPWSTLVNRRNRHGTH